MIFGSEPSNMALLEAATSMVAFNKVRIVWDFL
jgi:hypothetical protein